MKIKDYLRNSFDMHYKTDDGLKYQIMGEEVKITGYTKKVSIIQIPSHIADLPVGILSGLQSIPFKGELYIPNTVHTIADNALSITKGITKIILPDSVQEIGVAAFSFSEALEELVLPEGLEIIEKAAFSGCKSLRNIRLPSTLKRIEKHAFEDCDALVKPNIPSGCEVHEKAFG